MTNTIDNDPISQLPEPYRVAWEILHEPFDYRLMLRNVLTSAQKMVGATWGMMILDADLNGLESTFPGFRTLPDTYNTSIPVGRISSFAYVLTRRVIQDVQGILISDIDNIVELDENRLLDKFLPLIMREKIMTRTDEEWFASRLLEIPSGSQLTAIALPIVDKHKIIGGVYLHRPLSYGAFTEELLLKAQTFLTCVAIGVKNARDVEDKERLGFQIISLAAHELRTPIIVIKGYAQILRDGLCRDDEINKFSGIVFDHADRLGQVLDDYLDYARIEQGLVYKKGVNLNDVIRPAVDKYQSLINDKHQSLVLDLPSSLDVEVEADNYLSKVIDMFIRGAHLYTPDGGEIRISILLNEDLFRFRVSDAGPSLTEDEQAHLFQKYYHSKRDEVIQGSGLDLYLAKRIVELWGGQIGADCAPNQGNTFWFTIPMTKE